MNEREKLVSKRVLVFLKLTLNLAKSVTRARKCASNILLEMYNKWNEIRIDS